MTSDWDDSERERAHSRLADMASDLPGVQIEDTAGHTGFLVRGKRFAWFLVDHHGDGRLALCVKAPLGEQETLVSADRHRYFVPAYLGAKGWVGVNLDAGSTPDWSEVGSLLEQGWRMNAPKSVVTAYDAARG